MKKILRITKVNDSEIQVEDMTEDPKVTIDNEELEKKRKAQDKEYSDMMDMCKDMEYENVSDALTDLKKMKDEAAVAKKAADEAAEVAKKKAEDEEGLTDEEKAEKAKKEKADKKAKDAEPDFTEVEKSIADIKDVKTRDAVAAEFAKVRDSIKGYVKGDDLTKKIVEAIKTQDAQPNLKGPKKISYSELQRRNK